jgi:hypothetical protein
MNGQSCGNINTNIYHEIPVFQGRCSLLKDTEEICKTVFSPIPRDHNYDVFFYIVHKMEDFCALLLRFRG